MATSAPLVWDKTGEKIYETGVSNVALYVQVNGTYPKGVAWNGVTAITESPSGAESNPIYADNIKYGNLLSAEELGATIEAYTYPDEFAVCDGSAELMTGVTIGQQKRSSFGLSWKSLIGNDTDGTDFGYKIKLMYGCMAAPSERANNTVNESPEAMTMSWEISTTPVAVKDHKPTALVTIDSTAFTEPDAKSKLAAFEKVIWGSDTADARLPLPDEVATLLGAAG